MTIANPNKVEVAIVSVGYADFLNITLPLTKKFFGESITILTTESDHATIDCAIHNSVKLLATNAWYETGGVFDKAAGLNQWLDALDTNATSWVLTLDADIVLPPCSFHLLLATLNPQFLYGVKRRLCKSVTDWERFISQDLTFTDFDLDLPEIKHGKLWGLHDTVNVSAVYGYFQLWHIHFGKGQSRFESFPSAAHYDVQFAMSFGDTTRANIPSIEVLHLGPIKLNWEGRKSESWNSAAPLDDINVNWG